MKNLLLTLLIIFLSCAAIAQDGMVIEKGTVTFLSSKKVYVKFSSTENIQTGDTLFVNQGAAFIPVVVVENKSSSSTVCTPIGNTKLKVKDEVVFRFVKKIKEPIIEEEEVKPADQLTDQIIDDIIVKPSEDKEEEVLFKEKVKGRISAASYSNFSDYQNVTRMRYGFNYRGYNLNNSKFSVESYITFRHTLNDSINLADALKVYGLSVKYEFDKTSSITFGRKINPRFSSIGAIDGLQFEKKFGQFSIGAIAGTRPKLRDYSFDPNLLQFGAYVGLSSKNPAKYAQSTLGFIEQMNKGNTDRRFVYFQHSSQPIKNLNLFGSFEVDLFENFNEQPQSTFKLTNVFVSLRYRIGRNWRVSASYDNRRNIIYYESYKNFLDQLIEDESRQGIRFGLSHRAFKTISWGINGGMRFQQSGSNPSKNLNAYVTMSRVPYVNLRASLRANFLQTDFLDSQIFGLYLSKSFFNNKLDLELYYRWVDYKYKIGERVLHQDIGGASISYRLAKNLSLHLFYEGVKDNTNQLYHRFNVRIIKRF